MRKTKGYRGIDITHHCELIRKGLPHKNVIFNEKLMIVVENTHAVDFYCLSKNYQEYKNKLVTKAKNEGVCLCTRDFSDDYCEETDLHKSDSDDSGSTNEHSIPLFQDDTMLYIQNATSPHKITSGIE